jgi:hypothetical protein
MNIEPREDEKTRFERTGKLYRGMMSPVVSMTAYLSFWDAGIMDELDSLESPDPAVPICRGFYHPRRSGERESPSAGQICL